MVKALYLNNNDETHLRDARHAHQIFTSNEHKFSPKVKFLYHVYFETNSSISDQDTKQIGVLCNTTDLPSYAATVETKQQYNRKKNVQTRIDYNSIRMSFYDDNSGLTRKLLETYYKYYFLDGTHTSNIISNSTSSIDFGPRDKYSRTVPKYGMNNGTDLPFFKFIKLYQLSRQQWFSYTLINPIISRWSHDDLAYAEGAAFMQNEIEILYEGVIYNSGNIDDASEPVAFASGDTGYDLTPSPLTAADPGNLTGLGARNTTSISAIQDTLDNILRSRTTLDNRTGVQTDPGIFQGGLKELLFPKNDNQNIPIVSRLADRSVKNIPGDRIQAQLRNDPASLDTVVKRTLATGSYSSEYNSSNFGNFDSLGDGIKTAITNEILDRVISDPKIAQIASQVLRTIL